MKTNYLFSRIVAVLLISFAAMGECQADIPAAAQRMLIERRPVAEFERHPDLMEWMKATDAQGCTLAYHAAKRKHWDVVELLFAKGYDPLVLVPVRGNSNLKRQRGVELLVLAAQQGQTDWVRRLLDAGVNPDTSGYSNPNFMDALGAALVFGHSDTAYLLIERGAPLNRSCSTPPEWLDEKFRKAGNRRAGGYPTNYPIHFAVMRRDLDALRLLILNRVDPNKLN